MSYYADDWLTILLGDCREVMAAMEPESVQTVVTSPPYWGLRDYGTASWVGGDETCDHSAVGAPRATRPASGLTGGKATVDAGTVQRDCRKCGAIRQDQQLGLEPTPEAYVAAMVDVFREVRRVLRSDGTVWLNLGDSYAREGGRTPGVPRHWDGREADPGGHHDKRALAHDIGLKQKDLVGIPWRVAFALQADGWYLRSDIIWSKPNPMPESVTDRPTKSHEYIFLLSKSPRYYFDADAVREEGAGHLWNSAQGFSAEGQALRGGAVGHTNGKGYHPDTNQSGRNIRSVWTVATQPYPGAHFATFPPKLIEPCIKAGCPEGGWVLDPFAGSGTTGLVANRLGRRAVLIDLNADYLGQVMERAVEGVPYPLGLETA